jgi:3-phenylpropionate/trans-cinnamate dioxygenase ferredoxin subunit
MFYKLFGSKEEAEAAVPMNTSALIRAGKLMICLAHTEDGFFAVSDSCTHLRAQLHKGTILPDNKIKCPWHGYGFSLRTGEETSGNGCRALRTFRINLDESGLYIEL